MNRHRTCILICGVLMMVSAALLAQEPVQTMQITERFGVTHLDQIIDFDLNKPVDAKTTTVLGPDGTEVPYQLLDGGKKLAVRTDLPAYATKRWQVIAGKAPAPVRGVVVTKADAWYEITNGCIGLRIPTVSADLTRLPAPIQGVCYQDGTWSGPGRNLLTVKATAVTGMSVRFLEQGPLKVVAQIRYTFDRPEYRHGAQPIKAAGPGYYTSTITIEWQQPSILFEEDTDMTLSYAVNVYDGLQPDTARTRKLNSTDMVTAITYNTPIGVGDTSTGNRRGRISVWNPWDSWYYQLYDKDAPADANLFGIFPGCASIALGAHSSGVGIHTAPGENGGMPVAGVTLQANIRQDAPHVRFGWGMFLGVKGRDLPSPHRIQPIVRQMSIHSGINLNKMARYQLSYPDPERGYGGIYMSAEKVQDIIMRARQDKGYFGYLRGADPTATTLVDFWADTKGESFKRTSTARVVATTGNKVLLVDDQNPDVWLGTVCNYPGVDEGTSLAFDVMIDRGYTPSLVLRHWRITLATSGAHLTEPEFKRKAWKEGAVTAGAWHHVEVISHENREITLRIQPAGGQVREIRYTPHRTGHDALLFQAGSPQGWQGKVYLDNIVVTRALAGVAQPDIVFQENFERETVGKVPANMLVEAIANQYDNLIINARALLRHFVEGDGIYANDTHYWHGGLAMSRDLVWIDCLLASEHLSAEQRDMLKAIVAMYGYILCDDDYVPLFNGHGQNLGTPNMPIQQSGYRNMYALYLSQHPDFRERAAGVTTVVKRSLESTTNEYGSHMGCVHYVGAAMGPLLSSMQQLKVAGIADLFKIEPRMANFARFYMHFTTPPEPRFGMARKMISVGDSATESSELTGQMATAFTDSDPLLSRQLMAIWRKTGKTHSGFHATTLLKIDETLPDEDPKLGAATFPGYYSVLRYGWNTPQETAVWFVNGDTYRDHYHNDNGTLVAYALGAPLSLDWGSLYSNPSVRVDGGAHHSLVLPEAMYRARWDQPAALNAGGRWWDAQQKAFLNFRTAKLATATFGKGADWQRTVQVLHPNADYPVILIRDAFQGGSVRGMKISTLNLMATGEVETPAGPMTPPVSDQRKDNGRPSAGPIFPLRPGVNKFGFTGASFGGTKPAIDWDLYTIADETLQANIGNWAWSDFERQHILRLRGVGPFTTVILPVRKGAKREVAVERDGANLRLTSGEEITLIGADFYAYSLPDRQALATFTAAPAIGPGGMQAEGGPVEILLNGDQAIVTAHGDKGPRTLTLPGAWTVEDKGSPLTLTKGKWIFDYQGREPLTVALKRK